MGISRLARRVALFGGPLALGILGLTHPLPIGDTHYEAIRSVADWWVTVHIIQLFLIAALSISAYLLLEPLTSRAASASRVLLLVFLPFYGGWDAVAGISTGLLAQYANTLPAADLLVVAGAIQAVWDNMLMGNVALIGYGVGSIIGWLGAMIAAALAMRAAGAPRLTWIMLILAGVLFGATHVLPFGPLGMLCFLVAAWQIEFGSWRKRVANPAATPPVPAQRYNI